MHRIASSRAASRLASFSQPLTSSYPLMPRRLASSYSPTQSRSWKSTATRWGLAIGAVYFYNTTPAFAESRDVNDHPGDLPRQPGIDKSVQVLHEERHEAKAANAANKKTPLRASLGHRTTSDDSSPEQPGPDSSSSKASGESAGKAPSDDPNTSKNTRPSKNEGAEPSSEEEGEEEGDANAGAYNPETGEINWDCPCLGGMAHGPCGPEFREAFSCFVHSEAEPKGVDCIDKFKGMQECFAAHPEVYGDELEAADKEVDAELAAEREIGKAAEKTPGVEGRKELEKGLAGGGEGVMGG